MLEFGGGVKDRSRETSLRKAILVGVACLGLSASAASASEWRQRFFDPDDGYLDVSGMLSRGGFLPVPVIVTEPAVKGGLGFAGQFVEPATTPGGTPGRTIAGGVYTGNGSWGGGVLRQGSLWNDQFVYRVGLGVTDLTLPTFPFGGRAEVDYENSMKIGFANIRYRIPETALSIGPRFTYRSSDISLQTNGPVADRVNAIVSRFIGSHQYVGAGLSVNYDTRNNPFTPTSGINAIVKYDVYPRSLGSDREFTEAQLNLHAFRPFGERWSLGGKLRVDTISSSAPFFMMPAVDLRGVQYGRYQGTTAISLEFELRHQFTPRWAGVAFGGYGQTFADNARLYDPRGNIWAYGLGFRYRIARRLGIDLGIDVARGPESTIFYIQFGHAWAQTMD
jgi:hypothetical protein